MSLITMEKSAKGVESSEVIEDLIRSTLLSLPIEIISVSWFWVPSDSRTWIKYLLKSKSVDNEIEARDYINQILKGRETEDLIGTFSTTIIRLNDN